MKIAISILIVLVQLVVSYLLGIVGSMALVIGDGWELPFYAVAFSLGVWSVGRLASLVQSKLDGRQYMQRLIGTAVGSVLGVLLMAISPGTGFAQILYPLIGALIGYYAVGMFKFGASQPLATQ